ncbi:Oidioi.mRNA.OKI2018_I69.XSR.g14049.t1.cds [Oikopleura dioica]|uniref:Oidioi.mRNA.OKI2018_I69.XSR.g14049.t1.cds n=1 Tax=Oikopleura dioica TaxID=34765 RepID=A0ABN7SDJ6_OIKDI|nr:Oidioi.mRNA.OKI2018_I69.XSR.g14049.t1.cds [Oikopleura dioica]
MRLAGIWIEFTLLVILIVLSIVMMLVALKLPRRYLAPSIILIPFLILIDFAVKATCYESVFFNPTSAFGVISLVEFWIRYVLLFQTWTLLLTAIRRPAFDHSDSVYNSSGSTFYRAGASASANGSSIARSNSSKWEKPPFKKIVRRAASVPPGLSQISERGTEEDGFHQRSRSTRTKRSINSQMTASEIQQSEQQSYNKISLEDYNDRSSADRTRRSMNSEVSNNNYSNISSKHSYSNRSNRVERREMRNSYDTNSFIQHEEELAMEQEMESEPSAPPPPRTRPLWHEPVQKSKEPQQNGYSVPARQTSTNSSINKFRSNWQGATNWKSLREPVSRLNSDLSEMTQYSMNGMPRNRHESQLI